MLAEPHLDPAPFLPSPGLGLDRIAQDTEIVRVHFIGHLDQVAPVLGQEHQIAGTRPVFTQEEAQRFQSDQRKDRGRNADPVKPLPRGCLFEKVPEIDLANYKYLMLYLEMKNEISSFGAANTK